MARKYLVPVCASFKRPSSRIAFRVKSGVLHWARLHAVREALNRPLELAEEREIERLFADCAPGAIPAAGQAYELETLLDEALTSLAEVYFEAGDHEQLVRVTGEAFLHLMRGARRGHFSHEG